MKDLGCFPRGLRGGQVIIYQSGFRNHLAGFWEPVLVLGRIVLHCVDGYTGRSGVPKAMDSELEFPDILISREPHQEAVILPVFRGQEDLEEHLLQVGGERHCVFPEEVEHIKQVVDQLGSGVDGVVQTFGRVPTLGCAVHDWSDLGRRR